MIRPNVPKRDYQIRLSHSATVSERTDTDVGMAWSSESYTTWGSPQIDDVSGIRMTIAASLPSLSSVGSGSLTINTMWGSWTVAVATLLGSADLRLELYGVTLSMGGSGTDCAYSLSVDSFQAFWEQEPTDPTVPVLDLGSVGDAGGYDGRQNTAASAQSTSSLSPEPLFGYPSCAVTQAAQEAYGYEALGTATGGYRWRVSAAGSTPAGPWQSDETSLAPATPLSPLDCACVDEVPPIGWEDISAPSSWRMVAQSKDGDSVAVFGLGTATCPCDTGTTFQPFIYDVWRIDRTTERYRTAVNVVPKDWGITETTITRTAGCDPDSPGTTTDEDATTSSFVPNVCPAFYDFGKTVASKECRQTLQEARCGPGDGGGGP